MKRLAALQAWPPFSRRPPTAASTTASRSSVLEHEERVGAAQLEHDLLEVAPGDARRPRRPRGPEPVSETPCTRGSAMTVEIWSLVA